MEKSKINAHRAKISAKRVRDEEILAYRRRGISSRTDVYTPDLVILGRCGFLTYVTNFKFVHYKLNFYYDKLFI
jgi:hypothetical protein